jgi:predicted transcriptional regulator
MDELKIAELKDIILEYLSESSHKSIVSITLYDVIKPANMPISDFNVYIDEMHSDDVIYVNEMSQDRSILRINDKGRKYLHEGGYTKDAQIILNARFKELLDEEKRQKKLDLEIEALRASIKHYRNTRRISVWAIIISILSFVGSILFKIFG